MKQIIGGYVNFVDGDELKVRGVVVAHVEVANSIVTIQCHDNVGSSIYIGNSTDDSKRIDDAINCVWSGLSIGLTWNK